MSEFYRNSWHTAAKSHRCDDCNGTIEKGERYFRTEGKQDGDWFTFRSHESCHKAVVEAHRLFEWCPDGGLFPLWDIPNIADAHELLWLRQHHHQAVKRIGLHPAPRPVESGDLFSEAGAK